MKKSNYTDARTMGIRKQAENGVAVSDLRRMHGLSLGTFYINGCLSRCKVSLVLI
ncbi:MAG: hypothetical protein AAGA70_00625 [Pseudomonadota bacterium]